MNKPTPSSKIGKFFISSDNVMAVLLVVSLWQIAMCLGASVNLVPSASSDRALGTVTALATNAPSLGQGPAATKEAVTSFSSVANHG
jgi:hypothetical protein